MDEALVTRVLTADLFRGVTPEWLRAHGPELRPFTVAAEELIIDQGEAADEVFVVLEGRVEAVHRDGLGAERTLATMGTGDTFGEIALLTGGTRTTAVRAAVASEIAALSESGFRQLLADHPALAARVTTAAAMRLRQTTAVAEAMEHLGLADPAAMAEIEPLIESVQLAPGDVLFREGDVGDSAYVVLHGRLQVVSGHGDDERVIGELGRGEVAGEMAVLDDELHTATAFAVRETYLARFPPAAIEVLVERFPRAVLHVARTALRRARQGRPARRAEEQLSITVVPLGSIGPAAAFASELAAALEHVRSQPAPVQRPGRRVAR